MRVLFTSVSGYGHLHPLLPLAASIAGEGHDVAFAIGPELKARAEAAGFRAFESGLSVETAFQRLAERFPDGEYNRLQPEEILGWYTPNLFGAIFAPAMLDDLERILSGWPPDLVLSDVWEFAGPVAAAAAGIPSVSQSLGPRASDRTLEAVAATVAPLWRGRGLQPDPTAGLYRHLCFDITPPSLQPDSARSRPQIRPLRPVTPAPLPGERLPAWIERGRKRPLVYMTLGTNTNSDRAVFRSVIEGVNCLELDLLITVGPGGDAASLGSTPANVHVEEYVPQSLLLPHCAAVICHGGAGTTLNALSLGLPLLVLPQGADQYVIGELVAATGAGQLLRPPEVGPASVRACLQDLLNEPVHRAAATRLAREIAAMPGPEDAVRLIEEVAASAVA